MEVLFSNINKLFFFRLTLESNPFDVQLTMFDASIDVGSLCVVVVVVVCSWGLSLLLSLTCWNSYKKSRPNHLYCTQCSSLQYPPGPPIPSLLYQYPSYALPPSQPYHHYQGLPHTAERLGILESGEQPAMLAPVLQSSHGSDPTPREEQDWWLWK